MIPYIIATSVVLGYQDSPEQSQKFGKKIESDYVTQLNASSESVRTRFNRLFDEVSRIEKASDKGKVDLARYIAIRAILMQTGNPVPTTIDSKSLIHDSKKYYSLSWNKSLQRIWYLGTCDVIDSEDNKSLLNLIRPAASDQTLQSVILINSLPPESSTLDRAEALISYSESHNEDFAAGFRGALMLCFSLGPDTSNRSEKEKDLIRRCLAMRQRIEFTFSAFLKCKASSLKAFDILAHA